MHLIIGGRSQGKLEYAKTIVKGSVAALDFRNADFNAAKEADIIYNIHSGIRKLIEAGTSPLDSFKEELPQLMGKILIGDEIGSGIVPADSLERNWRDETGRIYVMLSENATRVDRVWAGCVQNLKGNNE